MIEVVFFAFRRGNVPIHPYLSVFHNRLDMRLFLSAILVFSTQILVAQTDADRPQMMMEMMKMMKRTIKKTMRNIPKKKQLLLMLAPLAKVKAWLQSFSSALPASFTSDLDGSRY